MLVKKEHFLKVGNLPCLNSELVLGFPALALQVLLQQIAVSRLVQAVCPALFQLNQARSQPERLCEGITKAHIRKPGFFKFDQDGHVVKFGT